MHPRYAPTVYYRRHQGRHILEPQQRRLRLAMPEHPRLDHLISSTPVTIQPSRILDRDPRHRLGPQRFHELNRQRALG
jgi:hypothetical protein